MKKYNKLTTLVLLIILVFTSFFIWKTQAASPNPKVNIVTIEGDAEYLKTVELYADASNNLPYGNHPVFQLKNNIVKYVDDRPFVQRVDGNLSPFIDDLISEYRSFMRGKTQRADQYIVTNDWVVYTAMATDVYWQESAEDELIISIMNKKTKEEKEYTLNLGEDTNYFNLEIAYLNYPELSIVLTKYDLNGNAEHVISTFDFDRPEAELIEQINFSDRINQDEFFYAGNAFDKTGRFIPFQKLEMIETTEIDYDDIYTNSSETSGYFIYDITNRRIIDIPLFEKNSTLLFTDQNQIFVAEDLDDTLGFYEVNPNTETLESIGNIDLAFASSDQADVDSYNNLPDPNRIVYDGKLYAYEQQVFKGTYLPVFKVIDLQKNETLFHGRLDASEGSKMDAQNINVIEYRLNPAAN